MKLNDCYFTLPTNLTIPHSRNIKSWVSNIIHRTSHNHRIHPSHTTHPNLTNTPEYTTHHNPPVNTFYKIQLTFLFLVSLPFPHILLFPSIPLPSFLPFILLLHLVCLHSIPGISGLEVNKPGLTLVTLLTHCCWLHPVSSSSGSRGHH